MGCKMYGYVRVSSKEQNLERQLEALKAYGVADRDIITDKQSGKDFDRKGYILLKDHLLRQGDVLIIKELDRLGRDYDGLKQEWNDLIKMGVDIVVLDNPILSTKDKNDLEKQLIANIVFELTAYIAEKERLKIRQRQAEGIAAAKADGKTLGRPKAEFPKEWEKVYGDWKSEKITAVEAFKVLNLPKPTFYRLVKRYEEGGK